LYDNAAMTPQQFIAKWQRANLTERSACQQHFLDLCELLEQEKPAEADPDGEWYTFERGAQKTGGGDGWADVWMRGHFGWEYKGKRKDLAAAYQQLLLYREDLENPPLLVVCDMDRFEIHTNFTGTVKKVYAFDLAGLANPANLYVLRKLFTEPEALRPDQTAVGITEAASALFGQLADGLRGRGIAAADAAHFVIKLVFCLFAEDIGLLPSRLFTTLVGKCKDEPKRLAKLLKDLFETMSAGGDFGADTIDYFNGGLFADAAVIELRGDEIERVIELSRYDWSQVEPSIFGTLFERTLDPDKRAQIGAHYTSKEDILTLVEPVLMAPLRREWAAIRERCDALWAGIQHSPPPSKGDRTRGEGDRTAVPLHNGGPGGVEPEEGPPSPSSSSRCSSPSVEGPAQGRARRSRSTQAARKKHDKLIQDFVERLAHVRVLDPACGSGNFLYVAIQLLLDVEKEVIAYAAGHQLGLLPQVRPTQLHGIEINPYAQQLVA
jgi:hypothetical protein